ncbi:MAG TPA: membrane protein insertion efficiency factor YidD [Aquificaceae bacterium]|nr:membrane protein insertion efficiency factor YidD [Aquificaceae bacterium]HIQ30832.1 membrane protein insertion efficiency factor YidD [Aquifex aeolicus]
MYKEEEAQERFPRPYEDEVGKEDNTEEKAEGKEEARALRWFLVKLIRLWQVVVSPLYPASCKYYPSCSHYAIMAIEKHGAFRGSLKALWRVLRCNPWTKGGVDLP